jgi:DNA-binding NarL/FixJ family response regulator
MSSDDNAEHRRRAAELNVHEYIRKGSFGQQRLAEAAREVLAGS